MSNYRVIFENDDGDTHSVVIAAEDEMDAEIKSIALALPDDFGGGHVIDIEETDDASDQEDGT